MNREYKVWDTQEKKWYVNSSVVLYGDGDVAIIDLETGNYTIYTDKDRVKVSFYTGINDKNDKKMYGGSIINHYLDKSAVGVITYGQYGKNVGFYVKWISGRHKELLLKELAFWDSRSSIIGHVDENPELLEVKDE